MINAKINELEAILFALTEPIAINKIGKLLGMTTQDTRKLIEKLSEYYNTNDRGISVYTFGDKVQLGTNPKYREVIASLYKESNLRDLSMQAYEVLSIIAYKQPVTKYHIEEIRGLSSDKHIYSLLSKQLIEVKGVLEKPGRPKLYGTTDKFLRNFGIRSIEELPEFLEFDKELKKYED